VQGSKIENGQRGNGVYIPRKAAKDDETMISSDSGEKWVHVYVNFRVEQMELLAESRRSRAY
jgi:hypothetical protein